MFDDALQKVLNNEGGYSNNPNDAGSETYKGISRKYNPNWSGWQIIDNYKFSNPTNFKSLLDSDDTLNTSVSDYYKQEYWDKQIAPLNIDDNQISTYLFDMCVNIGSWAKIVQVAINKNLISQNKPQIAVDGILGKNSKAMLSEIINTNTNFINDLVEFRVKHYVELATKNSSQLVFLNGWINRSYSALS